jgi:hypothetical protein
MAGSTLFDSVKITLSAAWRQDLLREGVGMAEAELKILG